MKTNRLISLALVTIMALTVVSGAGVLTAQKAQANLTPTYTIEAVKGATTPPNPVAGDTVIQMFTLDYTSPSVGLSFGLPNNALKITDPNGTPLNAFSGLLTVVFSAPQSDVPAECGNGWVNFPASVAGTYSIQLSVNVNAGAGFELVTRTISVTVFPDAGGPYVTTTHAKAPLTLSASAAGFTGDLTYAWSVDNPPKGLKVTFSDPAILNPTVKFNKPGTWTLNLTVTSSSGQTGYDTATVTVNKK